MSWCALTDEVPLARHLVRARVDLVAVVDQVDFGSVVRPAPKLHLTKLIIKRKPLKNITLIYMSVRVTPKAVSVRTLMSIAQELM